MPLHVILPGGVVVAGGTLVVLLVAVHLAEVAGVVAARNVLLAERTLQVVTLDFGLFLYRHYFGQHLFHLDHYHFSGHLLSS